MISFIDEYRAVFGVEPICRLLPIAPSTYYENIAKSTDVGRLSARERNDLAMKVEIRRVFDENFRVYGVRKVWRQLQREDFDIARCTVARLMKATGLQGIIRGIFHFWPNQTSERPKILDIYFFYHINCV